MGTLVVGHFEDEMPVFGKVVTILVKEQDPVLKCYQSTSFDCHTHCYIVQATDRHIATTQSKLSDYHPLMLSKSFTVSSPLFVRLKHDILQQ